MGEARQVTSFWNRLLWQAAFLTVALAPALALGVLLYDVAFNNSEKQAMVLQERERLRAAVTQRLVDVREAAETLIDLPPLEEPAHDPRFTAVVAWREGGRPQLLSGSWSGSVRLPGTPKELLGDQASRFVADGDELLVLVASREPFLVRVSMPWFWQALDDAALPACGFVNGSVVACSYPLIWRVAQFVWGGREPAEQRRLDLNLPSADGTVSLRLISLAPPPLRVWLPTPPAWSPQERFLAGALLWLSSLLLLLRTRPQGANGNIAAPVLSRGGRVRA